MLVPWDTSALVTPSGLTNPDARCWFNALAQALRTLTSLRLVLSKLNLDDDPAAYHACVSRGSRVLIAEQCSIEAYSAFLENVDAPAVWRLFRVGTRVAHIRTPDPDTPIVSNDVTVTVEAPTLRTWLANIEKYGRVVEAVRNDDGITETRLRTAPEIVTVVRAPGDRWDLPPAFRFPSVVDGAPHWLEWTAVATVEHSGGAYSGHWSATVYRTIDGVVKPVRIDDNLVLIMAPGAPIITPHSRMVFYHYTGRESRFP
jgi:hypothetical protein